MPTHLTARELAELCLVGLPSSKRGINLRAEREGWPFVERAGRGGGKRYAVSGLPPEALADLRDRRAEIIEDAANPVGRPKGSDFFSRNPDVAAAVETIVAERGLAAPRIRELLAAEHAELPSMRTLQRFMAQLEREKPALIAARRDPDHYKSAFRVSLGRADASVSYAHELWELDTTPADVLTKGGRKAILGVIDRWSRRARFLVVPSESGQSVRRLLVDTIRQWGVMPAAVMTDNGSGFINRSIKSALEALAIEHRICPPGTPENKPFVERLFGTFTRERAEILAGYAGHSVADAQKLRARAKKKTGRAVVVPEMTPEELQDVLDNWVDGTYHQRTHSSLRMSPMKKWQSSPTPAIAAPSEDILKLALSALVGSRTVGKRGVQWKRGTYWCAACAEWMGREVIVRRDEDELGELYLFSPDGRFIDIAIDHQRAGLSERDHAMLARRQQDAFMKDATASQKRQAKDFSYERARDELLRQEAEAAGKVTSLPLPTRKATSPTIDSLSGAAAGTAASATERPPAERPAATVTPLPVPAAAKVIEADKIIDAAERGEPVDEDALAKARLYRTTAEYQAQKMMAEHFAERTGTNT